MESRNKVYLDDFNPQIIRLDSATQAELSLFSAGKEFVNFSKYIQINDQTGKSEALEDLLLGQGVTHLIVNNKTNKDRDIVAYFTLINNVIPYDDGIDDDRSDLSNYPSIPVAEIKMFAVSELYQDIYYKAEDEEMPISAWCLHFVIAYLRMICDQFISFKAIFLHSLPTAEPFYKKNGFLLLPEITKPLYSMDQELTAMWLVLKEINL